MLPTQNRLRAAADITRVYKRGVYGAAESYFSLKAAPNGRATSRAVVVVAKKVDKRAVVRNRLRRRLVETLRGQWGTVPSGYDIVISVHADLEGKSAEALRSLLAQALRHARLTAQ